MTKPCAVIDTNVLRAANGGAGGANEQCVEKCIDLLVEVRSKGRLALDVAGEILAEYGNHCHPAGRPGLGDEFFRWVLDSQYTECVRVDLTPNLDRGYDEFPDTDELRKFDKSDRKFVATALGCDPVAEIFNALDSDWRNDAAGLAAAGVVVRELCPDRLASAS